MHPSWTKTDIKCAILPHWVRPVFTQACFVLDFSLYPSNWCSTLILCTTPPSHVKLKHTWCVVWKSTVFQRGIHVFPGSYLFVRRHLFHLLLIFYTFCGTGYSVSDLFQPLASLWDITATLSRVAQLRMAWLMSRVGQAFAPSTLILLRVLGLVAVSVCSMPEPFSVLILTCIW